MKFFTKWVLPLSLLLVIVGGGTFLSHYATAPPRPEPVGPRPPLEQRPAVVLFEKTRAECDLRLMFDLKDVSGIPTEGTNQVVVADVEKRLHFRIFDSGGKMVVDTDENRLPAQADPISKFREKLKKFRPPHELTRSEKAEVVTTIASILGRTPEWSPTDPSASPESPEFEFQTSGHYDFPFDSLSTEPATVSLAGQSCTCFTTSVAFAAYPETSKTNPSTLPADRWKLLETGDKKPVPIPGVTHGWFRIAWVADRMGSNRLASTLVFKGGAGAQPERLEVPIKVVPPLMVVPALVQLPDLTRPGQQVVGEAFCVSATRDSFDLPVPRTDDPRFAVECQPLKPEALANWGTRPTNSPLKAGYRIQITVTERLKDGKPLDLGPFHRTITLEPKGLPPLAVDVVGVVRGAIRLSVNKDGDRIDLGTFPRNRDKEVVVPLTADSTELTLKLAPFESDKPLQAELDKLPDEEGRPRWNLRIKVSKEALEGPLPPTSAVTLESKAPGEEPRLMRIPVVGQATR